uniref:Candidate secreted effector n=1 Tax=Meloidogyne incognita TaxID=6306 RepID=A0A914MAX5_MELIC
MIFDFSLTQEKNKPGLLNKFIDGAKTLTNYGIDTAKHIFDIGYKWATKTFSRATFSMGIKQRTRHRMPKEEGGFGIRTVLQMLNQSLQTLNQSLMKKTKSNDIPKNTAQTRNKKDDDGDNSDNSKKDDDGSGGGSPPSNNSPNNSNSFAKAVIAGAAVGAVVGGVVGGLSGALVGGAVGAATVAIVYACDAVVKTCNNVNNVINNVKNEASSCYESVKEIVKSAWNWFKGLFS